MKDRKQFYELIVIVAALLTMVLVLVGISSGMLLDHDATKKQMLEEIVRKLRK